MRLSNSRYTSTAMGLILGAFFVSAPSISASAQSQRPVLAAQQCQPLSNDNFELCCVALNRRAILSRGGD